MSSPFCCHVCRGDSMRVALFFDGKNFYTAFRKDHPNSEIDYNELAAWLTSEISGGAGEVVGAYYYTGYSLPDQDVSSAFGSFLEGLELQTGYFVKREPRVRRKTTCRKCGSTEEYSTEKRVDTRLVADLIHYAAADAYDAAVLLSGDQDFVPAVEAANALGKRVYLAAWRGSGVSRELRVRCYGQIDLEAGVSKFSTGRSGERREAAHDPSRSHDQQTNMLSEIGRALELHPYLSRGYFINKWRAHSNIPEPGSAREQMLDTLIGEGKVVEGARDSNGQITRTLKLPSD